ncbi:MAG TPA: carboxymuconolactone decarboxylase family protein [Bacteroidales bacterium]|nr:carboxymuconolactone decarboxylase family protein [Bacteroidales bacterium]HQP04351.1 carboxymuconolactone decarboxylase family protein [Bacteroidales bacterium]
MDKVTEFANYRSEMNKRLLESDNKIIKRIFSLDSMTYTDSALSAKVKEMLGLATSLVLRCDDCVKYHLEQCYKHKLSTDEIFDILAVCNVVGGTIVIPHTRRAVEYWDLLNK